MHKLPSGALCRSKYHNVIEHYGFYECGMEEGTFLFEYGVVAQRQYDVIKIINDDRWDKSKRMLQHNYFHNFYKETEDQLLLDDDGDLDNRYSKDLRPCWPTIVVGTRS